MWHKTTTVVLAILLGSCLADPLLCQRKKGLRIFKKDANLNCFSDAPVSVVDVTLLVPTYREAHASGHWIGLYKATCTTHYFFWGSYTKDDWHGPVPIIPSQRAEVKQGGCPSTTNPVPLLHHIDPPCTYTWPTETVTETLYCVTRPTTVRKLYGQPITSDEEPLDQSTINNNGALTISGAAVYWEQDIIDPEQREEKYTGTALLQDHQLIIESLQEGFTLISEPTTDGPYEVWKTVEGYEVRILQKSKRSKRQIYPETIQGEVTSKLQYESYVMDKYLQKFQQTCYKQYLTTQSLDMIYRDNADEYARALLNETDITAAVAGEYLLVWPCKRPDSWYPMINEGNTCTQDVPICYTSDGHNYTGYYRIQTGRISNHTTIMECNSVQITPYVKEGALYLWDGAKSTPLSTKGVKGFNYPLQGVHLAPTWSNHWIYHSSDFHREPPHYITAREVELHQQVTHEPPSSYHTLSVPFVNMPSLPSFARCVELASLMGGFLYLCKIIMLKLTSRRTTPLPTGDSPLELYRLMRSRQ